MCSPHSLGFCHRNMFKSLFGMQIQRAPRATLLGFALLVLAPHPSHAQSPGAGERPLVILEDNDSVSANIQATALQDVLQAFSDATGVEIIVSGSADETVSVQFDHLPADEALREILGERSSISFYASDASDAEGTERLTRAWVLKGIARAHGPVPFGRKARRTPRSAASGGSAAFDQLKRQALTHKDPDRRKRAIEGLIAADSDKAKSALTQALLNDRNAKVRQAALENLLWYDDEAPRQPLIKAALRDSSAEVRRMAIEEGFAELAEDDPAARRVLIQALGDKDPDNRVVVVEALGDLAAFDEEDRDLQRALMRALKDDNEAVRLAAIEPLEDIEMKSALAEAAKNDPSSRVQRAAREALSNLE